MTRDDPNAVLTPSQLNTLARDLLEGSFPAGLGGGRTGQRLAPRVRPPVLHAEGRPRAGAGGDVQAQEHWLKFQPREGLRVLARGRLTLYEARGEYQMVLDHMEEAGEGALRRAFEELKARLAAEGLFDDDRKRPLPLHARRIAVITSPTGAAVRDVLSVLARRFPLVEVDVLPVPVQGEAAAAQIRDDAAAGRCLRALRRDRCWHAAAARWKTCGPSTTKHLRARSPAAAYRWFRRSGHETDFSLTRFRRRPARADAFGRRRAAGAQPR